MFKFAIRFPVKLIYRLSSYKVQEKSINLPFYSHMKITEKALRLTRKSSHNMSDTSTSTDGLRSEYRPREEE